MPRRILQYRGSLYIPDEKKISLFSEYFLQKLGLSIMQYTHRQRYNQLISISCSALNLEVLTSSILAWQLLKTQKHISVIRIFLVFNR